MMANEVPDQGVSLQPAMYPSSRRIQAGASVGFITVLPA